MQQFTQRIADFSKWLDRLLPDSSDAAQKFSMQTLLSELSIHCYCVIQVNNNTIYNWASLNDCNERHGVQPILYTDVMTSARKHNDDALVTSARRLGWAVLQVPRVNGAGLPFLKYMYYDAATRFSQCTFYGYSNGDILFNQGLVYSLAAVAKVSMTAVSMIAITALTISVWLRCSVRLVGWAFMCYSVMFTSV